jgi:hypothetical protein
MLPGTRLLAIARLLLDPQTIAQVLEPLVADWQREWIAADTTWRRILVRVPGCIALVWCAAYCFALESAPGDVRRRAWPTLLAFTLLGTIVLTLPIALARSTLIAYWLPSTLTLAVPFAVLPLAMRLGTHANRIASRRYLLRFTIGTALFVFVLHGWITPNANQMFREHVLRSAAEHAGQSTRYTPPPRGLRELTITELFVVHLSPMRHIASPSKLAEELQGRVTLPLVPVLLAIMGWSLARVSSAAGPARLLGWWAFACATFASTRSLGMTLERSWGLPREVAIWLPLVMWLIASVVLMRTRPDDRFGGVDDRRLPSTGDRPA